MLDIITVSGSCEHPIACTHWKEGDLSTAEGSIIATFPKQQPTHSYIRLVEVCIRDVPNIEDDGGPVGHHMLHGDRGIAALAKIAQETDPDRKLGPGMGGRKYEIIAATHSVIIVASGC